MQTEASEPWLARGDRARALWLFLSFLFLYLLTSGGHFYASDDVQKYNVLTSLWKQGSVAIADGWTAGRDGLRYSWFSAGSTLMMLPGFLLGHAVAGWVPSVSAEFVARFFITLQNAVWSAALVALVFVYTRFLGHSAAGAGVTAGALGLATTVWPYAKTAWSEPATTLFAFAGLFAWQVASREGFRRVGPVLLAGCGFAACYAIRQEMALLAIGAVLVAAWQHRRKLWPLLKAVPLVGLPVLPALAINLFYNWARYGSPSSMPNFQMVKTGLDQPGLGKLHWALNNLYHYTVNPNDGLLLLAPPALLGLFCWVLFWRRHRAEAQILTGALGVLAGFLIIVVWHPGWAWGLRFTYTFVPFLVLPLAVLWDTGRARGLLLAAIALGVAVQLVAVLHNYNYLYEAESRAHPGLPIQAIMSDPAHAPLWLAIKATPRVLAGGARVLGDPPPRGASEVAVYRQRAQDVPDFWAFLMMLTPMPRPVIFLAVLALLLGLGVSLYKLRRAFG